MTTCTRCSPVTSPVWLRPECDIQHTFGKVNCVPVYRTYFICELAESRLYLQDSNVTPPEFPGSFKEPCARTLPKIQDWQTIETFLTLELSQYLKSGSNVFSSKPFATLSGCRRLGNALCLCSPVRPAQAVLKRCPKSSAIDLAVKKFNIFWTSFWEWLPDDL